MPRYATKLALHPVRRRRLHYAAFDVWVGRWEVLDARSRGIPQASRTRGARLGIGGACWQAHLPSCALIRRLACKAARWCSPCAGQGLAPVRSLALAHLA